MKCWLGIVSREHVMRGVAGDYVQVCHGKAAPLRKMIAGDWFIYYSPVDIFKNKDKLQKFTAIGRVKNGEVYQVEMFENFKPFRCDVEFHKKAKEVAIATLKSHLSFTQGNYGMLFRRGHLEISIDDCRIIAKAMGINIETATAELGYIASETDGVTK